MSERKVLNKYYPPDFDPSKIPKVHAPKNKKFVVRLMAPCNMRCKTCGEYIYQGKKFNARKEDVLDMNYLGLRIYRFYIKCPKCVAEISFRTDPESQDYVVEAGATRNFEAVKLLDEEEKRIKKQREDEEANNPMKVLENRTKDSKQEMEIMENIEELRELNTRQADVDHFGILKEKEEEMRKRQEEDDENEIRKIFGKPSEMIMKRLDDSESDDEEEKAGHQTKSNNYKRPTDFIHEDVDIQQKKQKVWDSSVGRMASKSSLSSLVKVKKTAKTRTAAIPVVKTDKPTVAANNSQVLNVPFSSTIDANDRTVNLTIDKKEESTIRNEENTVKCSSVERTVNPCNTDSKQTEDEPANSTVNDDTSLTFMANIKEGMLKKDELKVKASGLGLDLLWGYSDSDDSNSDTSD